MDPFPIQTQKTNGKLPLEKITQYETRLIFNVAHIDIIDCRIWLQLFSKIILKGILLELLIEHLPQIIPLRAEYAQTSDSIPRLEAKQRHEVTIFQIKMLISQNRDNILIAVDVYTPTASTDDCIHCKKP
jgi:hypothetical protein